MDASTHAVRNYFKRLGLESDIADIYLALHAYGAQTMSRLAQTSGVERTRLYRLIETLKAAHLVEIEVQEKRTIVRAADISNLQILLSEREHELRSLQEELQTIQQAFGHATLSSPLTKVHFYQGPVGNRQMFWNQTHAQGETLAILYENMQNKTNATYFERWVRRCNERGMHFRGLIGQHFIETQQAWYASHSNERLEHWQARFIDPQIFPITHSTIVYDDVVAYYNWKDGEIFGIEVHNLQIADAQRRVFEMLWPQAMPVDDLKGLPNAQIVRDADAANA